MLKFKRYFNLPKIMSFMALVMVFGMASANMSDFLDDYEEIVSVYEQFANKPRLCTDDLMQLNTEILPKLLPLAQTAQSQQGDFTAAELQRYMEVMMRYNAALGKLAPKMDNIDC